MNWSRLLIWGLVMLFVSGFWLMVGTVIYQLLLRQ